MTDSASTPPLPLSPDYERRFGGVARLYGNAALARFRSAHVCVVGIGGVGSWTVEALARSGVGALTLVDLDHIAESNINRQLHALDSTLGQAKIEAMAARIHQINPDCQVVGVDDFVAPDNLDTLLGGLPAVDVLVDAIDGVRAKTALLAWCRGRGITVVTCGAAGGQLDPCRIRVEDLARTTQDPLLAKVRGQLRKFHGFPRDAKKKFAIAAVYSEEPLRYPDAACAPPGGGGAPLNCAGFGSAVAVTASFGLTAASVALGKLAATAPAA
ncbi:tRNA threonylcarbamoyladenosine dehydratase [Azospira sp. I13]|uniref:tRNA threonylcarbamoyladenosine dehydratase n=1 Tax=Azospira sp. I13 TaxID=1765050 RepID=UPI000D41CA04|nr:tRNA threonylcarbamoyladenosine dehydratase [Azospira sp. I13]GBG01175.1 tRNA threonylcarbamoyladenosine dehydratase [Azospira sp. I13]